MDVVEQVCNIAGSAVTDYYMDQGFPRVVEGGTIPLRTRLTPWRAIRDARQQLGLEQGSGNPGIRVAEVSGSFGLQPRASSPPVPPERTDADIRLCLSADHCPMIPVLTMDDSDSEDQLAVPTARSAAERDDTSEAPTSGLRVATSARYIDEDAIDTARQMPPRACHPTHTGRGVCSKMAAESVRGVLLESRPNPSSRKRMQIR